MTSLASRLHPNTYQDEEPVGVCLCSAGSPPDYEDSLRTAFIPESLFRRLLCLGSAYSLHFAACLDDLEDRCISGIQASSMIEEVEFLGAVVADPALKNVLDCIVQKLDQAAKSPGQWNVWFSPP